MNEKLCAEDYISFIELGRRDKISLQSLKIIAEKFRELQQKQTWIKYPENKPEQSRSLLVTTTDETMEHCVYYGSKFWNQNTANIQNSKNVIAFQYKEPYIEE